EPAASGSAALSGERGGAASKSRDAVPATATTDVCSTVDALAELPATPCFSFGQTAVGGPAALARSEIRRAKQPRAKTRLRVEALNRRPVRSGLLRPERVPS